MAAISLDLRKRILLAFAHDSSSLRVAERFKVSPSFVRKLRIQVRRTGSPAPIPRPGKERLVKGAVEERLRKLLEEHRDVSVRQWLRIQHILVENFARKWYSLHGPRVPRRDLTAA